MGEGNAIERSGVEGPICARFFRDAADPLLVLGSDRTIEVANDAFRGVVPGFRPGMDLLDTVSTETSEDLRGRFAQAAGGETVRVDVVHPREDGGSRRVGYRFFPLDDGRVGGIGRMWDEEDDLVARLDHIRAALREKPARASHDDPWTGPWDRERTLDWLVKEWCHRETSDAALSCLVIRVGGVGAIGRREGPEAADGLLRAVSGRIRMLVRERDIVGRYGDDSFLVLAIPCDCAGAERLRRRLAGEIAATRFAVGGRLHRVVVHVGCGCSRSGEIDGPEALLLAAENDLPAAGLRPPPSGMGRA